MKTALFPGSFDPFTSGHEAIVRRALALFDKVYVAVGVNTDKHYMFSTQERLEQIRTLFAQEPRVEAISFSGMTIDLCHQLGAQFIVRGVRNAQDLEYEQTIAAVNHQLDSSIDTVILLADTAHKDISSTLERERLAHQK
ncbi:MAG: pantetheine-phosphate adenylyltransferase [Bacteroidales bacterium]|nr:pantetheine-phosphate adenylyltransferase [Bacteroidales bacterium]